MKYANGDPGPDWGQTQKCGGVKLVHCLQYTCWHFTSINFYYLSGENFYKNNITHVNDIQTNGFHEIYVKSVANF